MRPMRRLLSNRRGMFAGVAALLGAGLHRLSGPQRAEATHDATSLLHFGRIDNNASAKTTLSVNLASATPGLLVTMNLNGNESGATRLDRLDAVQGLTRGATATGVVGLAYDGGTGVRGESAIGTGFGVMGIASGEGLFPNTTAGVWGTSQNSNGVIGTSTNFSGVFGISGGAGPGLGAGFGVVGTSSTRVGVFGSSNSNVGVKGTSISSYGLAGASTSSFGLVGYSSQAIGVYGKGRRWGSTAPRTPRLDSPLSSLGMW